MSLRDLPPVKENVPQRDKASQTLLARQAVCARSTYLYLKHDGGVASHEMHRGSALHEFCRVATLYLIDQGEARLPWEVGKDIVAQVVGEHPEWAIPPDEMDVLRLSAYHWCECKVIDPSAVVAVEKLFELQLGGMRVRGKVDYAEAVDGGVRVEDYKSQAFVPSQDEIDAKVQLPLYALLVGEGYPVREEECERCDGIGLVWMLPDGRTCKTAEPGAAIEVDGDPRDLKTVACPDCETKGTVETPEPPIGQRFGSFDIAEVYPRLEPWLEGTAKVLPYRGRSLTRQELVDQRLYVEGLVAKLKHGLDTGDWPAVPGSHCSTCAAPSECPLPGHLRDWRGSIETLEQAREAAEKAAFDEAELSTLKRELREFAKANDTAIPAGTDEVWSFETVESEAWVTGKKIGRPDTEAAKEAMLAAIDRSVRTGEPFDYSEFRRPRRSSKFAKRKVKTTEQAETRSSVAPQGPVRTPGPPAEAPEDRQARLDERYGETAPW